MWNFTVWKFGSPVLPPNREGLFTKQRPGQPAGHYREVQPLVSHLALLFHVMWGKEPATGLFLITCFLGTALDAVRGLPVSRRANVTFEVIFYHRKCLLPVFGASFSEGERLGVWMTGQSLSSLLL